MFGYSAGKVCLILYRRPWCQTFSKAWLTSRKTAEHYLCSSKALLIMSVMRWHCCIVECVLRNPNWWEGIQSCRFVSLYILLSRSFSSIFDKISKRLIGLTMLRLLGFILVSGSWWFLFVLTFWRRNYFFNFSTLCIQKVNNTGTKRVRNMKQTAF